MGFVTGTAAQDLSGEVNFARREGTVWQYDNVDGAKFFRYDFHKGQYALRVVYEFEALLGMREQLLDLQTQGVKFTATEEAMDGLAWAFGKMNENEEEELEIWPLEDFPGLLRSITSEDIVERGPEQPALFPDGHGSIPSHLLLRPPMEAIMNPKKWKENKEGKAIFRFDFPSMRGEVRYKIPGHENGVLFQDKPELSLPMLDALTILVNESTAAGFRDVGVSYQTIIEARGGKNLGKSKAEEALRWTRAVEGVTPLHVAYTVRQAKRRYGGAAERRGGFIIIAEPVHWVSDLITGEVAVLEWRVIPGAALLHMARELPRGKALVPQALVALDPYHQEKAKRLGYHFVWSFRVKANKPGQYDQAYAMGKLLDIVGIELPEDVWNRTHFKEAVKKALDLLVAEKIIKKWKWVDGEPKDFDEWLKAEIQVWPTEYVLQRYSPKLKGARLQLELPHGEPQPKSDKKESDNPGNGMWNVRA